MMCALCCLSLRAISAPLIFGSAQTKRCLQMICIAHIVMHETFYYLYRATVITLNPVNIVREIFRQTPIDYLLLFFLFVFLIFFVTAFRMSLSAIGRYTDRLLYIYQASVGNLSDYFCAHLFGLLSSMVAVLEYGFLFGSIYCLSFSYYSWECCHWLVRIR